VTIIPMNRNSIRLALAVVAVIAAVPLALGFRPQVQPPPTAPHQITAGAFDSKCNRTLTYVDEGEYLRVSIAIDTKKRKVHFVYSASAGAGARDPDRSMVESVSFTPTALCRSRVNPRGFYIAGRSSAQAVLEFWQFNTDEVMQLVPRTPPARSSTDFDPPTITRTALPMSNSIGWPCDMTAISPCTVSGASEEVWVMEWESRDVYGISPTSGAKTLRIAAALTGNYRSMDAETHSIFGDVVILQRRPWHTSLGSWSHKVHDDPTIDPDLFVLYDTNLDGVMEASETISTATRSAHALYSTGSFTDIEQ
jgi:hypothetical protein